MSVSRPLCCSVAIDGSDDAEAFITHIQTNVSSRRIVVRRATVRLKTPHARRRVRTKKLE